MDILCLLYTLPVLLVPYNNLRMDPRSCPQDMSKRLCDLKLSIQLYVHMDFLLYMDWHIPYFYMFLLKDIQNLSHILGFFVEL